MNIYLAPPTGLDLVLGTFVWNETTEDWDAEGTYDEEGASGDEIVTGVAVGRLEGGARIERIPGASAANARVEAGPWIGRTSRSGDPCLRRC